MSNLFSVKHACNYVGLDSEITYDKEKLLNADAIILPGVGSFPEAMRNLKQLDLISPIKDLIASGKPFMGVCLGLQLLFSESEEFGCSPGLDIINGRVVKFKITSYGHKKTTVPSIGWEKILNPATPAVRWADSPLKDNSENEYMYFIHSYYVIPDNEKDILAITKYGDISFCSAIAQKNIFAVQFHPEKSATGGIQIYKNWKKIINENQGELI